MLCFKRLSSITFFLWVIFGLNIVGFAQSLDPLETQPSDFGEMERNINNQKESIPQNRNEQQKPALSEIEAFVAQAKKWVVENSEIRSAERQ